MHDRGRAQGRPAGAADGGLRLGLEGSYRMALEGDSHFTPKLELGARHDGGDAETGFGVEIGGGVAWVDPVPATRRGPSFSLRQDFGRQAQGGLDALFNPAPLEDRTGSEATSRWAVEAAYGFPGFGGRFTGSPHVGLGLSTGARDYSLGWRLAPEAAPAPDLSFGLKAIRSTPPARSQRSDVSRKSFTVLPEPAHFGIFASAPAPGCRPAIRAAGRVTPVIGSVPVADGHEGTMNGRIPLPCGRDGARRFIDAGMFGFLKSKALHEPFPASLFMHAPTYSYPPARDDDDCALAHGGAVILDQIPHRIGLLRGSESDEPDDTRMGLTMKKDELAEILVLGDQHPTLAVGQREQFLVRGAGMPVVGRHDVVTEIDERLMQRARSGTAIEKKPHEAARTAARS